MLERRGHYWRMMQFSRLISLMMSGQISQAAAGAYTKTAMEPQQLLEITSGPVTLLIIGALARSLEVPMLEVDSRTPTLPSSYECPSSAFLLH